MSNLLKRKTILMGLLCVVWLVVIFYNGTRQGEVSQRSSKEIVKVISKFINISPIAAERASIKFINANFYVRKNAHFFQYLVLSILICSIVRQLKLCKSSEIFLVLFLLLLFPVADEFIQKYIPGRSSSILDIIIDFSGGVLGMLVFKIAVRSSKSHLKTRSYF
jgi:VanZ family protein